MTISAAVRDSMLSTIPPRCVMDEITSPIYSDGADTCTFMMGCMSTAPASEAILSKAIAAQEVKANGVEVFSSYSIAVTSASISVHSYPNFIPPENAPFIPFFIASTISSGMSLVFAVMLSTFPLFGGSGLTVSERPAVFSLFAIVLENSSLPEASVLIHSL